MHMQLKILVVATVLLCGGCTRPLQQQGKETWASVPDKNFSDLVNRYSDPQSVDCGFVNLLDKPSAKEKQKMALECIETAIQHGKAFKFGKLRAQLDSMSYEGLVRSSSNEYWLIVYDIMADQSTPQKWVRRCKDIQTDHQNLLYQGKECVESNP